MWIGAIGNKLDSISIDKVYEDGHSDLFYWCWERIGDLGVEISDAARQRLGGLSPFCRAY